MPANNHTLLVVESDALVAAALVQCLRAAGFVVLEARDSAAALAICRSHAPALAIVDSCMPKLAGVGLAQLITSQSDVALFFLSTDGDAQTVKAAVAAGALAYLVKPFDAPQLLAGVHTALERAREFGALRQQARALDAALRTARTVSVAVGVLMGKLHLDQEAAFESLRRHARSNRRRLEEVAEELLQSTEAANRLLKRA